MNRNPAIQELNDLIEDIQHHIALFSTNLEKASKQTASCRRARVISLELQKFFKAFRKLSCDAGLK